MRTGFVLAAVATIAAMSASTVPTTSVAAVPASAEPSIGVAGVQVHLRELQRIAQAHGGNRATGTPGYRASLEYVKSELDAAGLVTTVRTFETRQGTTSNLIAETRGGDPGHVVMVGAHLDSAAAGYGINDNATGSAAVLEAALQYAESGAQPENKLRFAFWGAEELGLLGSRHYVDSLSSQERERIALYLNFDMVGSPNAGYFTYDGDDSEGVGAGPGPAGSARIEKLLNDAFARLGVTTGGTDFDGRSDYGSFIAAGIPAGGSFTGAGGTKTAEEARMWGGRAGSPYDPCYHRSCDTLDNVDSKALGRNAKVIMHAVRTYARQAPG